MWGNHSVNVAFSERRPSLLKSWTGLGLRHRTTCVIYSLKFLLSRWRRTYLVNKYIHWRINRTSSAICHRYESKAHSYIKPLTVACAVHGRGASAFQRLGTMAPSTIPHSSWQGKQDKVSLGYITRKPYMLRYIKITGTCLLGHSFRLIWLSISSYVFC